MYYQEKKKKKLYKGGIYLKKLQEYKDIRNNISHEKYDMIKKYLKSICKEDRMNEYIKEINKLDFSLPDFKTKVNNLKKKYGIVLLNDVLNKKKEREKYEIWYNEKYLHRNIEILNIWLEDYEDLCCNAILYKNGKQVANIITSYDETSLRYSIGNKDSAMSNSFLKKAFKSLIYVDFDDYLKLPKISEASKLLQSIYDDVCSSDSSMCHITEDDWDEFYSDDYTNDDFETLKLEVKKFGLENVIGINEDEYKIIGYSDLETKFNDDRNLQKNNDKYEEYSL